MGGSQKKRKLKIICIDEIFTNFITLSCSNFLYWCLTNLYTCSYSQFEIYTIRIQTINGTKFPDVTKHSFTSIANWLRWHQDCKDLTLIVENLRSHTLGASGLRPRATENAAGATANDLGATTNESGATTNETWATTNESGATAKELGATTVWECLLFRIHLNNQNPYYLLFFLD